MFFNLFHIVDFILFCLDLLDSRRRSTSTNIPIVSSSQYSHLNPFFSFLVFKMIYTQINLTDCLIEWARL